MAKILAFAASVRKQSFNRKLLKYPLAGARDAGAEVTHVELSDFPMPLFDEDCEEREGIPESALKLRELMKAHDGFLIASPEYNSSFSPLLKNTIDWGSRPREGEKPLECFRGKTIALVSASPGYYGGYRGLQQVRYVFGNIGAIVLPDMFSLPKAHEHLDPDGNLVDEKLAEQARKIGRNLAEYLDARR